MLPNRGKKFSGIASWPIVPLGAVFLLQLIAMLPIGGYDRSLPMVLLFPRFDAALGLAVVLLSLGHGALLLGLASVLLGAGRSGFLAAVLFISTISCTALMAVFYYIKFGSYPSLAVARDFIADPRAFVAYGYSGLAPYDLGLFCVVLALVVCPVPWVLRSLQAYPSSLLRTTIQLVIGALLVVVGVSASGLSPIENMPRIFVQHTLPMARFYGALLDSGQGNRIEEVMPYLPRRTRASDWNSPQRAKHVLLVVAESIRAEHTPFMGFERNTLPELFAAKDDWIFFSNMHAHGPSTETSFPVIFQSKYLPTADTGGRAAETVWSRFRSQRIHTAWFGAGSTKWGQLDERLQLGRVDTFFEPALATPEERSRYRGQVELDYAVDDRVAIARLQAFYEALPAGARSFAVLHLCSSHYPYNVEDDFQLFRPVIPLGQQRSFTTAWFQQFSNEQIVNSYHNGLRAVDHYVADLLAMLRERGRADELLLILTADHGEAFGEHAQYFHGGKVYEELAHVPLLVFTGNRLGELRAQLSLRRDDVLGLIDLLPTVFDALRIEAPPSFEGISLLSSERKPYEILAYDSIGAMVAVLRGKMKYLYDLLNGTDETYNLAEDPDELHNMRSNSATNVRKFLAEVFGESGSSDP